jgi:predicted CXXCH cytochrome family protein
VHALYASGDCHACHDPHASDTPALLRGGTLVDHCRMCHGPRVEAMERGAHSHLDVEGSCLACHGPHAAAFPGLLTAEPRESCGACHPRVGEAVAGAAVSHDAVITGRQCLSCHEPHVAETAAMLRAEEAPVCMLCHDKAVTASDGRTVPSMGAALEAPLVHGPVRAGQCAACHSVHGANHARLLAQINPGILSGDFDIRNYALCFSCHDREMVFSESGSATEFRDGDTNLHRVHVRGAGRARGCGDCHAVHGAGRPRLIAESVPFEGSGWMMPLGFVLTADGGSCAPGCHEPLGYTRSAKGGGS